MTFKRLLVRTNDELWRVASLRSTNSNIIVSQPWFNSEANEILRLSDLHRTICKRTGKQHDTYVLADGTRLSIYADGLRIQKSTGFGDALDLLNRLRPILEHTTGMLHNPRPGDSFCELRYSSIPAGFSKSMGMAPTRERTGDTVVDWDQIHLRLGCRTLSGPGVEEHYAPIHDHHAAMITTRSMDGEWEFFLAAFPSS